MEHTTVTSLIKMQEAALEVANIAHERINYTRAGIFVLFASQLALWVGFIGYVLTH